MLRQGTILHQRYNVLEHISDGGMGAVYRALDMRLENIVAVKHMKFSPTPERVAAFRREAQLLARLHHPALPTVHDHFTEQGDHFLVMEYIEGQDLSELLRANGGPFEPQQVLAWADLLLEALGYLHRQQPAVIHRDIKPHNLKLTPDGHMMLLDFGLAKGAIAANGAEPDGRSLHGFTLQYAPFEQISGAGTDARSDLYALAATLYHLLAGVPPPNAPTRIGAQQENQPDPLPPLKIRVPNLPDAVDAALRRSLALKPHDRHASAAELRAELRASATSIAGRPQAAPPAPRAELRIAPAHSAPAGAISDSFSAPGPPPAARARTAPLLVVALVLSIIMLVLMLVVAVAQPAGLRFPPPFDLLNRPAQLVKIAVPLYSALLLLAALGSRWRRRSARLLGSHADTVVSIAFAPNGELVGSAASDGAVRIWRVSGGEPLACRGHRAAVQQLCFTPDSSLLVSASDDATIRLWRARDGAAQGVLHEHSGRISCIAVAASGRLLASAATDGTIIVWELRDRAPLHFLQGHPLGTVGLALAPDGSRLASAGEDGAIRIWSTRTGSLIHTLAGHTDAVCEIAFSPDGRTLASCGRDASVRLWNVRDGSQLQCLRGHALPVGGLAFHPGGALLASRSEDATVRLWRISDGRQLHALRGHSGYISGIAFVRGGGTLASAAWDGSVRLWRVRDGKPEGSLNERGARILLLAADPHGQALATGGMDRAVRLWQI